MKEEEIYKKAEEKLDEVVICSSEASALAGIGYAILALAKAISENNKEKT